MALTSWSEMRALLDQGSQPFADIPYPAGEDAGERAFAHSAERVDAGAQSPLRQETAEIVYQVIEGAGSTRVGEREVRWTRGDTFAIPPWEPYVHTATERAYLFRVDDRPLRRRRGEYRCVPLQFPDTDLRERPPRPATQLLGGLVLLARTIDKTKAKIQGTLGAYKVTPGMSGYLFQELGIGEDEFTSVVGRLREDDAIVQWVRAHSDPTRYGEINERLATRGFRDEEHRRSFYDRYPMLETRREIRTFFEMMELDDELAFSRPVSSSRS